MKQSLQLKMGQHLTMTPQLQQAIRLLQLSTLDLQQEIQTALENNPLLEESIEEANPVEAVQNFSTPSEDQAQLQSDNQITEADTDLPDSDWNEQIPDQLATDSSWDDTYQSSTTSSISSSKDPDSSSGMNENDSAEETLKDHLSWQLNLVNLSVADKLIGEAIIDGIDTEGYLRVSCEDILEHMQNHYPELFAEAEITEVATVLQQIQHFDPPGVAARSLSECLCLQLKQLPDDTPLLSQATQLCKEYLDTLGSRDFKKLQRKLRLKEPQLQNIVELIQSLNPYPGALIATHTAEYVVPDVYVEKVKDDWQVRLNSAALPQVVINQEYAGLIKRADNSEQNTFLKSHLQDARWFIKSLQSRNDTLMKVACEIVARQIDFLESGAEAMKPMVLHDIAEAVDMHESTISRVTTQKYMHTPKGIFELKYFFSSHVNTSDGGAASSTAIRAVIKKLIAAENPKKPLSDNKMAQLLEDEGIQVARRTIAKYREAMGIAPSNERKRLV